MGVQLVSNQINYNLMRLRSSKETKDMYDELGVQVFGDHSIGNGILTGKCMKSIFAAFREG